MSTGRERFLAAVEAENERVRTAPRHFGGGNPYYRSERNDALVAAVDGLELTGPEWGVLEWFVTWDAQGVVASVIEKARAQGPRRP